MWIVIQYSSPRERSPGCCRVGRAGHRIGLVSSGSIIATCADDVAEACAIARRAAASELEEIKIHEKPDGCLANQIVGLEIDFGDISLQRVHQIVSRAYPFRDLVEELEGVVSQMEEHRLVRRDGGILQRTRKAREYYIENLSMIPDEKRYNVYDIVGRRSVGTLDEAFVVGFARSPVPHS